MCPAGSNIWKKLKCEKLFKTKQSIQLKDDALVIQLVRMNYVWFHLTLLNKLVFSTRQNTRRIINQSTVTHTYKTHQDCIANTLCEVFWMIKFLLHASLLIITQQPHFLPQSRARAFGGWMGLTTALPLERHPVGRFFLGKTTRYHWYIVSVPYY